MRIEKSKRTGNVLMSLTPDEAQLTVMAFQSFSRITGAQLADSSELSETDRLVHDLYTAMEIMSRILEVTGGDS